MYSYSSVFESQRPSLVQQRFLAAAAAPSSSHGRMAEQDEPEPEYAPTHDEHDFTLSLAELANEHTRALNAQEEGASPRSAERLGHQALFTDFL